MKSSIATFLTRQVACELLPKLWHAIYFVSIRSVCFHIRMRMSFRSDMPVPTQLPLLIARFSDRCVSLRVALRLSTPLRLASA